MKERNKFPQDKKSEHVKCRKTSIIILSSTRKNHLDKAKSMLSGIPALHSSFIQQSTKFSAYIIVIGNKILNKEPYIIIIANSVQSTRVKRNPHLVFQKTTDKMCSLWFFWHSIVQTKRFGPWHPNSQSAEGGVQWRLSTGLPCPSFQLISEPNLLLPAPADTGNVRVILARQSPAGSPFQERGTDVGWVKELSSVFVQFWRGQAHPQKSPIRNSF